MTPLADLLIRRIAQTGPITLADYMADCLMHPAHGYYSTRDPFGAAGDFTTAPEISQMFGELMGLALAQAWLDQGAPNAFTLAELGPGRGTLMADVLRATRGVPGFHAAARVVLVEISAHLRTRQRQALGDYPAEWLFSADDLPDAPLFIVANEFFDALPIRQFTRELQGWSETMVGVVADQLSWGRSAPTDIAVLRHRLTDTTPGEVVELCPAAAPVVATIGARIAASKGAALIVDYGGWQSRGDTFQALRGHAYTDPLAAPGQADLTAHVDFAALAAAAGPVRAAYTSQGAWLTALGIQARAAKLGEHLQGAARHSHLRALHRLTAPSEMGQVFKVLAIFAPRSAIPPGFS